MQEDQIRSRMDKVLENVRVDIATIRTGRATPALVEDVPVLVYGGAQKLRILELATISAPEAHSLLISPWDKSIVGEIRKGLEAANLGFNPIIAGEEIRINLPPLTAQDRENYVKLLHQKLEAGRVGIRQARQEGMHNIKNKAESKDLTEDEVVVQEKNLQAITDKYIAEIEEMGKRKESELRSL
ncbi:MAG: ribosome recycling factor [Candidatus Blackburnbacteria bacterium]|nr:ribosome recycling factor [Candidatus Blackburnbacteria bacterium]